MGVLAILLIGARIGGMFATMPIFGSRNYPVSAKIGLVLFLTVIVTSNIAVDITIDTVYGYEFFFYLVNEAVIGLFIGLLASVFLGFIYFAGDIIDYLTGFSMVSVMNPLDETQMPITSNLMYIYLSLVFLALNMHHKVILVVAESFELIPLGSLIRAAESLSYLMSVVSQTLLIGLSISAPFIITILVADIVLGLLAKAMPGMNIFILGMPFKVLIGVFMFLVIVPALADVFGVQFGSAFDFIGNYMGEYRRLP